MGRTLPGVDITERAVVVPLRLSAVSGTEITTDQISALFERYAPRVFRFCARRSGDLDLAQDLTSVTFLEARRHRDRMPAEPGALPWLLGVAANVMRNSARSLRRHRAALSRLPVPPDEPNHATGVADRAEATAILRRACTALDELPERDRDVVALVLWQGLT
ncbi:MAG: RNA polymerase sigma factor [Jatrophihabitans sp.]